MSDRAFLDTNVVVYAFDSGEPQKQAMAQALLEDPEGPALVLSGQVLAEFFVVVTRKLRRPVPVAVAADAVAALAELDVVSTDAALVVAAVDTARAHRLSLWDALVVEAAVAGGCDVLLTEDLAAGSTLRGVEVVNPFAS